MEYSVTSGIPHFQKVAEALDGWSKSTIDARAIAQVKKAGVRTGVVRRCFRSPCTTNDGWMDDNDFTTTCLARRRGE